MQNIYIYFACTFLNKTKYICIHLFFFVLFKKTELQNIYIYFACTFLNKTKYICIHLFFLFKKTELKNIYIYILHVRF